MTSTPNTLPLHYDVPDVLAALRDASQPSTPLRHLDPRLHRVYCSSLAPINSPTLHPTSPLGLLNYNQPPTPLSLAQPPHMYLSPTPSPLPSKPPPHARDKLLLSDALRRIIHHPGDPRSPTPTIPSSPQLPGSDPGTRLHFASPLQVITSHQVAARPTALLKPLLPSTETASQIHSSLRPGPPAISPSRPPRSPRPPSVVLTPTVVPPKTQRSIELNRTPPARIGVDGHVLPPSPSITDVFRARSAHLSSPIFRESTCQAADVGLLHSPDVRVNPLACAPEEDGQLPSGVNPEIVAEATFHRNGGFEESVAVDLGYRATRVPLPYAVSVRVAGGEGGIRPKFACLEHDPDIESTALVSFISNISYFETANDSTDDVGESDSVLEYEDAVLTFWAAPDAFDVHNSAGLVLSVVDEDGIRYETTIDISMMATPPQIAVQSPSTDAQAERKDTYISFPKDQNFAEETVTVWNETAFDAPLLINIVLTESQSGVFTIGTDSDSDMQCIPQTIPAGSSFSFKVRFELNDDESLRSAYFGTVLVKLGNMIPTKSQSCVDSDLLLSYDHVLSLDWNRSLSDTSLDPNNEVGLPSINLELSARGDANADKSETRTIVQFSPLDVLLQGDKWNPTQDDFESGIQYSGTFSLRKPVEWELFAVSENHSHEHAENSQQEIYVQNENVNISDRTSIPPPDRKPEKIHEAPDAQNSFTAPDAPEYDTCDSASKIEAPDFQDVNQDPLFSPLPRKTRPSNIPEMTPFGKLVGYSEGSDRPQKPPPLHFPDKSVPSSHKPQHGLVSHLPSDGTEKKILTNDYSLVDDPEPSFSPLHGIASKTYPEEEGESILRQSESQCELNSTPQAMTTEVTKPNASTNALSDAEDENESVLKMRSPASQHSSDNYAYVRFSASSEEKVSSIAAAAEITEDEDELDGEYKEPDVHGASQVVVTEDSQLRMVDPASDEFFFHDSGRLMTLHRSQSSLSSPHSTKDAASNVIRTGFVGKKKFGVRAALGMTVKPKLRLPRAVRRNGVSLAEGSGTSMLPISNGTSLKMEISVSVRSADTSPVSAAVEPTFLVIGPDNRSNIVITRLSGQSGKMYIVLTCNTTKNVKQKVAYEVPLHIRPYMVTQPRQNFTLDRPTLTFYNPQGAAQSCRVRVLNGSDRAVPFEISVEPRIKSDRRADGAPTFILSSPAEGVVDSQSFLNIDVRYSGGEETRSYYGILYIKIEEHLETMEMFGYSGGSKLRFEVAPDNRLKLQNLGTRYGFVLLTGPDHQENDQLATQLVLGPGKSTTCNLPHGSGSVIYTGDEIARSRFCAALHSAAWRHAHRKDQRKLFAVPFHGEEEAAKDENLEFGNDQEFTLYYASRLLDSCTTQYTFDPTSRKIIRTEDLTPTNARKHGHGWRAFVDWERRVHIVNNDTKQELQFEAEGAEPSTGLIPVLGDAILKPYREQVIVKSRGSTLTLTANGVQTKFEK